MAIRVYKPTSSARRFMSVLTFEEITKKTPEKSLIEYKKKNAGRNKQGKITVRHQGGGNKVKYRIIDFKRDKKDVPAKVAAIEYDPNRSAFIALLHYVDGEKRYILAPLDLKVGDTVMAGETADIKPGNALPLANIPVGTLIHNLEIKPGKGGRRLRPGAYALRRIPQVPHERHGHHRHRGQHRPQQRAHRQGRPHPPHGHPSHRPRRGHEPLRPSPWRRRGQEPRRYARSCDSVGQARSGPQDPQAQEIFQ